jgi:integrase/recombinase XerD
MSRLLAASEDYLAIRRTMGFKLEPHGRLLADLVAHLDALGQETITVTAVLAWATSRVGYPKQWAFRLTVARGFAGYLRALDGVSEIPSADLLPRDRTRVAPYLYCDEELRAVMVATERIDTPQRAAAYRALIGLLAVTGARIGEAAALDRDDVNVNAGCVTIRAGKWGAARELPLHPTTVLALDDYARQRDGWFPEAADPAFFLSARGRRVHIGHFREMFNALSTEVGIRPLEGRRQPRLHDIRHTVAVATLIDWYRDPDVDVAARIPRLSSYLGHAAPKSTYWYLQAAPELLALAAQRLEPAEVNR